MSLLGERRQVGVVKVAENKTRMVTFRCEEHLYKELQDIAGSKHETVSEWLREVTKETVQKEQE